MRINDRRGWLLCVATAAGVAALGCSTRQKTGAAVGGVSGAVVGAGVGAAAGGKKGALVGAGVGAAAGATGGALVGRYMDRQEAELRRDVQSARIVRQGDQLTVEFNSAILFDTGRADLQPKGRDDLEELAEILKKYDQTNLVVEGHTDSTGSREVNEKLSLRRAETVVEYLGLRGVDKQRLTPRGYAYDQPVASNTTADGRQKNRRVEIEIAPNAELKQVAAEEARGARASR
jgi:outer membrane protein OmpA-like peptidoglycan-associated protein